MLEPKTPLPWKPKPRAFCSPQATYGISGRDLLSTTCDLDDPTDSTGQGGFRHKEDMEYAVYAANLLPKLIEALQEIADYSWSLSPSYTAEQALKLAGEHKP